MEKTQDFQPIAARLMEISFELGRLGASTLAQEALALSAKVGQTALSEMRSEPILGQGEHEISPSKPEVPIMLTGSLALLYQTLSENLGVVVTKKHLKEVLWPGVARPDDTLLRQIGRLRKRVGDDTKNPKYIRIIHGTGCILAELIPGVVIPGGQEA